MTNEVRRTRCAPYFGRSTATEKGGKARVTLCFRLPTLLCRRAHRIATADCAAPTRAAAYTATIRDFAPLEGEDER
jgi:hypothetical protein